MPKYEIEVEFYRHDQRRTYTVKADSPEEARDVAEAEAAREVDEFDPRVNLSEEYIFQVQSEDDIEKVEED